MKRKNSAFIACVCAGFSLSAAPLQAQTAEDFIVNVFDSEDEAFQWTRWWGSAGQTYEFDPSVDAANNASSGSLKATIDFDLAAFGGDNQFALQGAFPEGAVADGTQYLDLSFDLRWDSASPKNAAGNFGSLEFGFRKADFSQLWLTPTSPLTIGADQGDQWIHVVAPIDPASPGVDQLNGVVLKIWSGNEGGLTGTTTFWVDNVKLTANPNVEIPPPTLSIEKAEQGLRLYASNPGSQYQRQNIRTVNPMYSWVGSTEPVTYSFTVADYPDTNHTGFQMHMFLVPGDAVSNAETSPDWNQPNLIFFDLSNNAEGGGYANLRYKVDQANGNAMFYNDDPEAGPVGALGGIGHTDIRGTWSLTFTSDTTARITNPAGTTADFELPADVPPLFSGPMYVYFGVQPNQPGNINQGAVLSNVKVTGVADSIDESFAGVQPDETTPRDLDPLIWERVAENPPGVVLAPEGTAYWIEWTVPAAGFRLQTTPSLATPNWTDVGANAPQIGNMVRVAVPSSALSGNSGFFRTVKEP